MTIPTTSIICSICILCLFNSLSFAEEAEDRKQPKFGLGWATPHSDQWQVTKRYLSESKTTIYEFPSYERVKYGEKMGGSPLIDLKNHVLKKEDINKVLTYLKLPLVENDMKEESKKTGNRWDGQNFIWTDYKLGKLKVVRALSYNHDHKKKDVIYRVMIERK